MTELERRARGVLVALSILTASLSGEAQETQIATLRAAAKASPNDPAASLALGKALRRAGRFNEAVTELSRGALLAGAVKGGLVDGMRYESARAKIDLRQLGAALAACNALGAPRPLAAACRAEAHLMQNRAAESLPEAQKALSTEAGLYEAKVAEGRSLALQGKIAEADQALRAAASSADARPEAHYHLGVFLANQGKRDAAVAELKKARAADSGDPEAAFQLGEALGATKEAQAAFLDATRIRPSFAAAHAALARVSLALGEIGPAETAATEAVKLDPKLHTAHIALGRVRVAQAKWDDALKEGLEAQKLVPNIAGAELVIADAHAGKGDIDYAVESYQKAFGLDRTDPSPLVRAALACVQAGRLTTAKGFGDKVTAEFAKWGPGWAALGDVLARQGDKVKARAAYESALKGDGPVDRDAVRKKLAALK